MAILKRKTCMSCGAVFSSRPGLFCRMCAKDENDGKE